MKICPHCEAKNKDQYLYCIGCNKPLPKQSHLDNLMSLALKEIDQGNYRKAVTYLSSILKLNIGNKEAWFLKGIAMSNLGVGGEARDCFRASGVDIREKTCSHCMASPPSAYLPATACPPSKTDLLTISTMTPRISSSRTPPRTT